MRGLLLAGSGVRRIHIAPSRGIPGPPSKPEMVFPVLAGLNEKDSREALERSRASSSSIAFSVNVAGRTRAILASFITLTTLPFSLPPQINAISLEDYIGVKSKHARVTFPTPRAATRRSASARRSAPSLSAS